MEKYIPLPLKALFYTISTLGSIHLIISHIVAFATGDFDQINYFHVLAIDLIWPELAHGTTNFWLSQAFYVVPVLWGIYLWRQRKAEVKSQS